MATYKDAPIKFLPGDVTRPDHGTHRETGFAHAEDIPFGRFVVRDSANGDNAVKLPDTTGEVTADGVGFAVRVHTHPGGYKTATTDAVSALKRGFIAAEALEAATKHGAVYVQFGLNADDGKVWASAAANRVALQGVRFAESIAAAGTVEIEVNPQTA
jgi:hypothetical protein